MTPSPSSTVCRVSNCGCRRCTPQPHTALGWSVTGIDKVMADVAARGGKFERFPPMQQDAAGIWQSPSGARIACLKDPDGKLLSLTEAPAR
jgi:hypothetical protein